MVVNALVASAKSKDRGRIMGYWTGSGVEEEFHSINLTCYECGADYLAEFWAEGSTADVSWECEAPVKRPWWAFWRPKICGYSNFPEVDL